MEVPLQIVFKNIESSNAITSLVRKRAAWLENFCEKIISCRVAIEAPHRHHQTGNLFHVRISLRVPGEELVISRAPPSHTAHKDFHVALHDAFDEARRQLEDYARRRRVEIKHHEIPKRAHVSKLIYEDGKYGFIQTEDGREIYFHSTSVLNNQYDRLSIGMEVTFAEEMGEKGPQASTVRISGRRAYQSH